MKKYTIFEGHVTDVGDYTFWVDLVDENEIRSIAEIEKSKIRECDQEWIFEGAILRLFVFVGRVEFRFIKQRWTQEMIDKGIQEGERLWRILNMGPTKTELIEDFLKLADKIINNDQIEFVYIGGPDACPMCGRYSEDGHTADCKLVLAREILERIKNGDYNTREDKEITTSRQKEQGRADAWRSDFSAG